MKRALLEESYKGGFFAYLDFSGMDLRGKDFTLASISSCDFRRTRLEGSTWTGAEIWDSLFDWKPPVSGDAVITRDGKDTPGVVVKVAHRAALVLLPGDRLVWHDISTLAPI